MPTVPSAGVLLDAVQNELRIPTSNTTERAKLSTLMSYVYGDICAKQDWWWLRRSTGINTNPKITDTAATVTQNSTTVTLSAAPTRFSSNVSVANDVMTVAANAVDSNAVYRVAAHTSGSTTVTLDEPYTGSTSSAATVVLYTVAYELPSDLARLGTVKRFGVPQPLETIGIEDLNYLRAFDTREGKPEVYSLFDFATSGTVTSNRMLQIHPYPDQAYRMEVWYKHQPSGDVTSDLSLPVDFQQVLVYGTIARGYAIFLNDLERSNFFQALFNDVLALMAAQQREITDQRPSIDPGVTLYRRGTGRTRRGAGTLGNLFDRYPMVP